MRNKIQGVCIKSYKDEDDLEEFDNGIIIKEDVRIYSVGDEKFIIDGQFDTDYWKPVLTFDGLKIKIC